MDRIINEDIINRVKYNGGEVTERVTKIAELHKAKE